MLLCSFLSSLTVEQLFHFRPVQFFPTTAGNRERFGDWEADLVVGAGQKQALVTIKERTSRYSLFAHVPFKTAQAVSDAMISLFTLFSACVRTLTTNNGGSSPSKSGSPRNLMPPSSSLIPILPGSGMPTRT